MIKIETTLLLVAPLAVALLVGCPAGVIELGCDWGCHRTVVVGGKDAGTGDAGAAGGDAGTGGAPPLCATGAVASCYDGPAGTEGVGLCQAGMKTCAADGASWGACVGAVLPQAEDCATPFDEDCDGMAPPCKGPLLWAKRFPDQLSPPGNAIAVDVEGNVIVAGGFVGAADFGGGVLQSAGGSDVFIAKLDANGGHLWSKRFGDAAGQVAASVAVDSAGNIVVTGYFAGSMDFGGGALQSAGGQDVFIVRLEPNGAHIWSKSFGDTSDQLGAGVVADGAGDVVVAGSFFSTVDFGGGALQSVGDMDIFIVKLAAANGGHLWSKSFGGAADQGATSVATDGADNLLLTGYFNGAVDFGAGLLPSAGLADVFIAKLAANGGHLWSKSFGDAQNAQVSDAQIGRGVTTDTAGNILVTGDFEGAANFGDGLVQGRGVFVVKLGADGGHVWSKHFGSGAVQEAGGVATDGAGHVLLTGGLRGSMDFGDGPIQSAGSADIFVAKLDADGASLWGKRFGDGKYQAGKGIATDGTGNAFVVGKFGGMVDFGGGVSLTGVGAGFNGYLAAFGP